VKHHKLAQLVHDDFLDVSPIEDELTGYDACFWCLGVSSTGMSEPEYRRVTVDFTLVAAEVLLRKNPKMTFCFISGGGTDRNGRAMWARVKAEAEDRLGEMGFARHYNFRPAYIQPMRGVTSNVRSYRALYAITSPFYGLLRKMPKYVTSTPEVGRAMIRAARDGAPKTTLENADICALAAG
jgi:uncharacterized protein YbjT (DUF2867 family)